jgi:hypothetical protein
LISDSTEQSEICAQSLLARSKPSPARTWSQRWKRDSWTQHLSGRILKPSHGPSFVTAWTSFRVDTLVSRSAQPASDSGPKTHDTSGRLSQPELLQCDQQSAFLRMSKDTFLSGCATCCKTWSDWVTERRGAWRQRVNAARLIRGSGSSSWPTIRASEYKDVGPVGSKSHQHMLGKHYLCAVVTQEAAKENWLTPQSGDVTGSTQDAVVMWANGQRPKTCDQRLRTQVAAEQLKHGQAAPANWPTPNCMDVITPTRDLTQMESKGHWGKGMNTGKLSEMVNYGQAAPASSSSLGSRQGLWLTPRANEPDSDPNFAARNADRGAHCHGTLSSQAKELWPTITAHTPDMESNGPNGHSGTYLAGAVKQWGSPAANDANKTPHCEVNSNQAGLAKSVGLELQRQWATPRTPTGGPESAQRKQELGRTTSGGGDLASQAAGKLNPRWVETLMGLPIGWTMPSCIRPVTIAPTSCDSSGTALCRPAQSERSDFLLAS